MCYGVKWESLTNVKDLANKSLFVYTPIAVTRCMFEQVFHLANWSLPDTAKRCVLHGSMKIE